MRKIILVIVAISLVIFGFVSGGMTKLVVLIGVAIVMVGFGFYGLFNSNKREDISNTTETSAWNG
jgi:mannose/fructose/N-acetylgalactosamine-specific phosphotransferase system component IIC